MTSILLIIGRISCNKFKCNYLKNQKLLKIFLKFTSNSEYFEKKDESHSLSIFGISDCEGGGYLQV